MRLQGVNALQCLEVNADFKDDPRSSYDVRLPSPTAVLLFTQRCSGLHVLSCPPRLLAGKPTRTTPLEPLQLPDPFLPSFSPKPAHSRDGPQDNKVQEGDTNCPSSCEYISGLSETDLGSPDSVSVALSFTLCCHPGSQRLQPQAAGESGKDPRLTLLSKHLAPSNSYQCSGSQ